MKFERAEKSDVEKTFNSTTVFKLIDLISKIEGPFASI